MRLAQPHSGRCHPMGRLEEKSMERKTAAETGCGFYSWGRIAITGYPCL